MRNKTFENMKQEDFKNIEKLYHFTPFDTAIKILESGQLKFGRLSNMNDLHENDKLSYRDCRGIDVKNLGDDDLDLICEEMSKYRQISLTIDNGDKFGFDLHQMWGLYAKNGEGVCFVFEKSSLCSKIDSKAEEYCDYVSYDKDVDSFFISVAGSKKIREEIRSRANQVFFHKRKEWEHEQEFRILKRCGVSTREEYFHFGDSLKYIIITSKLQEVDNVRYYKNIEVLEGVLHTKFNIPILVYENGLLEYTLRSLDGHFIWTEKDGYDVFDPLTMEIDA